mgnify:CR=1 FL=1
MSEKIFSNVAHIYDKHRPSYANGLFEYLYGDVGLNDSSEIADIGSGTGIFTKELLKRNSRVYAVEPNYDMRRFAEAKFSSNGRFVSVAGTAETTTLDYRSIDYITVAQAFHWFKKDLFYRECQRILKPQGKVILVWNQRDINSDLVREIDLVNATYCPSFSGYSKGMRGALGDSDYSNFFYGPYETKRFANNLTYTKESFIGWHLSASYRLSESAKHFEKYVMCLEDIFDLHSKNQKIIIPNFTVSYIGTV